MAVAIVGTPASGKTSAATNTVNITIPSTTAGSALVISLMGTYLVSSITATGATFARKQYSGATSVWTATNVSAGITTLTINWTGYSSIYWRCVELSGADTTEAHDTSNVLANAYNATDLGTGAITTGAAGMAVAIFQDSYAVATGCSAGSGWTGGTWDNTAKNNHEYRTTLASTVYGGTTGQATGAGSGITFIGFIVNIKAAGAGGGANWLKQGYWWNQAYGNVRG